MQHSVHSTEGIVKQRKVTKKGSKGQVPHVCVEHRFTFVNATFVNPDLSNSNLCGDRVEQNERRRKFATLIPLTVGSGVTRILVEEGHARPWICGVVGYRVFRARAAPLL